MGNRKRRLVLSDKEEVSDKNKDKGVGNVLSALPVGTPKSAVGIAVVFFVLVSLYPVVRGEVEAYIKYKDKKSTQKFQLEEKSVTLEAETQDKNLQALTAVVISQGEQITELSRTVGEMQAALNKNSMDLAQKDQEIENLTRDLRICRSKESQ